MTMNLLKAVHIREVLTFKKNKKAKNLNVWASNVDNLGKLNLIWDFHCIIFNFWLKNKYWVKCINEKGDFGQYLCCQKNYILYKIPLHFYQRILKGFLLSTSNVTQTSSMYSILTQFKISFSLQISKFLISGKDSFQRPGTWSKRSPAN